MEIRNYSGAVSDWSGDAVLIMLAKDGGLKDGMPFAGTVKELSERKDFTGKDGSLVRVPMFGGVVKNLYLAGLGEAKDISASSLRRSLTSALRTIGRQRNSSALIIMGDAAETCGISSVIGEAAELCGYKFDKYKEKAEDDPGFTLNELYAADLDEEEAERGRIFASAQIFARELANEPGCSINPQKMAFHAVEAAKEHEKMSCEVWDDKRLADENMGGIIAVGGGSASKPRFIHLTYKPNTVRKKIAIVGKGITFDSGGLNIKPDSFMATMKGDKSGACAVLAAVCGASKLKLDIEVHALLACAENMPSGSAFRPDDIIRARNGKTIEINNTDAEGRLVLADALCLASELKPDAIIDIATLTGACAVALGKDRAGLFARDEALGAEIMDASKRSGEPMWFMPAEDESIKESLKSPFADLVNAGKRYGGAIFAAMFLSEFVDKDIPWAHIDIAGTDFADKEKGLYSRGATGFGVRTFLEYLSNI